MAIVPLPPPPTYNMNFEDYEWMEWFRLVHVRVNEAGQFIFDQIDGQISWDQVDTTGSSITDIQSRSHSDLSDLDYDNTGHTGFARLEGDETQTFLVDEATNDNHAVPLYQVQDIAGGVSSSLTISDDGTEVSTDVGEINFGSNLSVTDDGSGIVTVDSSGGTSSSSFVESINSLTENEDGNSTFFSDSTNVSQILGEFRRTSALNVTSSSFWKSFNRDIPSTVNSPITNITFEIGEFDHALRWKHPVKIISDSSSAPSGTNEVYLEIPFDASAYNTLELYWKVLSESNNGDLWRVVRLDNNIIRRTKDAQLSYERLSYDISGLSGEAVLKLGWEADDISFGPPAYEMYVTDIRLLE